MIFQTFLIKYGEIGVKGKNRRLFEDALVRRIRLALESLEGEFKVYRSQGRIYADCAGEYDEEEVIGSLKRIFGIVAVCPALRVADEGFESLKKDVVAYMGARYREKDFSFKVEARRGKKTYPLNSMEINAGLGEALLRAFPKARVDVHSPQALLRVEIREEIYIYSDRIAGLGGMPTGTNGKAMLLLSGGIDSPVAGYMIAKRGVVLEAVYFHAPPYTSERAKQKTEDLAKILAGYAGPLRLHVVNFTDIQLYIYDSCPHEELTILMRRYMMRIAQRFAEKEGCLGLITGESIGQVASQTIQSLAVTNEACTLPVYRPLIGFDKQEIVEKAKEIGTYEVSIRPFEDCCTIFVAKHPVTKPDIKRIKRSEERLAGRIDELVGRAEASAETIELGSY